MRNFRMFSALSLAASGVIVFSACGPTYAGRTHVRSIALDPPADTSPSNSGLSPAPDAQPAATYTRPELWMHGIADPQRLTSVDAHGVRLILNVRKELSVPAMRQKIAQLQSKGLGLVITIRWPDPNSRTRPVKLDTAPSAAEAKEIADKLIEVLNLPESKAMDGHLWVQFYNEVAGGPGTIMPEQADGMYNFAKETAARIRKEAPHVKIAGPSLTSLDPLESHPRSGSKAALRREGLLRAIDWSIKNADAVDIHLHCSGGDDARQQLDLLRDALAKAGKRDMPIVSFEWSPARFAARATDLPGAEKAIRDIYQAMADHQVLIAAYAAFADTALKSTYEWAYLWDAKGRRHEPFFSLYKSLSTGKTITPDEGATDDDDTDPSTSDGTDQDDGN